MKPEFLDRDKIVGESLHWRGEPRRVIVLIPSKNGRLPPEKAARRL